MTQDKDLLLKYLCMALPYGVEIQVSDWTLLDTTLKFGHIALLLNNDIKLKPYLRPMSTMTRTELHEVQEILGRDVEICDGFIDIVDSSRKRFTFLELQALFGWFLKNHFDFMDLIPKGLAIEVTKENNPYEIYA